MAPYIPGNTARPHFISTNKTTNANRIPPAISTVLPTGSFRYEGNGRSKGNGSELAEAGWVVRMSPVLATVGREEPPSHDRQYRPEEQSLLPPRSPSIRASPAAERSVAPVGLHTTLRSAAGKSLG